MNLDVCSIKWKVFFYMYRPNVPIYCYNCNCKVPVVGTYYYCMPASDFIDTKCMSFWNKNLQKYKKKSA